MKKSAGSSAESAEMLNRYSIQSVEKALDVIEALSDHHSLSLIQLAELVNQPKSSLFRVILTLEKRGFISRSDEDGNYCLGFKQLVITKNLLERSSLRASAVAEMQKLVNKYGDTVNLCVLSGHEIVYVEIIEGTYALRMTDAIGSKSPFHATAAGKAIAAFLPENEMDAIVRDKGLAVITPNTITDRETLFKHLTGVREAGYAVDNQEITLGARCVAAPVMNMFGRVEGAVSLSGALHRFPDDKIHAIAEDIMETARVISKKLGYLYDR